MIPFAWIDSFTDRAFGGNPAVICLLEDERDPEWMQSLAREFGISETSFVLPRADGSFSLRWFTPAREMDLCGHATLAAAHMLWEDKVLEAGEQARFHTRSGELTCTQDGDWIEMSFPASPLVACELPDGIEHLGARALAAWTSARDLYVEVADEATLRALQPDLHWVAALPAFALVVTAEAGDGADYALRMFTPQGGIGEDPVTGSVQTALGPHWAERLGRSALVARQVSARGGVLRVAPDGARVRVAGQAVTIARGALA